MQAGLKLSGRYALEALLGSGGMGEVWRGVDEHLGRPVAVKVLREHLADPERAGRFRREATIGARLQHPGITVVHDVGTDNGQLFIVMELLHGRDLAAILEKAPAGLPIDVAVSLTLQAAVALQAAHAGHVVHRDLKPANLFVMDSGQLKICDFGIARAVDATTYLTATGQSFGTPAYMSPEQCRGQQVDERSDLYSLGCVLYALLTGRPPFREGEPLAIMYQHISAAPAAPRTIRPDVPPPLDRLVMDLLAKDPTGRPRDAGHVITALRASSYTPTIHVEPTANVSPRPDLGLPEPPGSVGGVQPVPSQAIASDGDATLTGTRPVQPGQRIAAALALSEPDRAGEPTAQRLPTPVPAVPSHLVRTIGHARTRAVAFSPDGRLLATGSFNRTALWDPASGDCLRTLTQHAGTVNAVAFSPDGRLLATASDDKTAALWDPATGNWLRALRRHTRSVVGVAFSPDGRLLATASWDDTAALWDPATGECLRTLAGHSRTRAGRSHGVTGVTFSPDGRLLATTSWDKTTRMWDPATGSRVSSLTHHNGPVLGVAFSPDGGLLVTANWDKTAVVWDLATGRLRTLTGHTGPVNGVAFSPGGRLLATASEDKTVRLWDPATGEHLHVLTDHTAPVKGLAFSPDGLLATADDYSAVRLWD